MFTGMFPCIARYERKKAILYSDVNWIRYEAASLFFPQMLLCDLDSSLKL